MKNLKKVLAMVLAFACTFTMFASAKVYEDVPAGSDYSEAITMLSDLGIIQGKTDSKYHPDDTITRAEACALIARLMTGDPNAAGFNGAHHFKDVPAGFWASSAIGYAVVNGITVGVDEAGTRFEPNRPIKDKEFVTMIVRALGYETPDMKKNFPFDYMSAAHAIGLLNGVNMVPETDALRGEDAQVIYNALFADYARGAKRVNVAHGTSVESYPTLAESVWNLNRAALGTWSGKSDEEATLTNCKAHTWVIIGADKKEEGRILAYPIDHDTTDVFKSDKKSDNGTQYVPYSFKYEGDVDSLKGYQVELWGAGKHGEPVWEKGDGKFVYSDNWDIKAIKTVKGQTKFDYNASMADKKSDNGTIELSEDKKLELDSVADNATKISAKDATETTLTTYLSKEKYNGEKTEKDKDIEKALNIRDGAQYKLMDWDSDGDIDWIVVDEANYFKVESASSKHLTVTSMKVGNEEKESASDTFTWELKDLNTYKNSDKKEYKVKFEVPEDLKQNDVIELTYKVSYDKKEKCEVITATAKLVEAENHELDKVATKDHLVLTFDGETKELAQANAKGDTIVPTNPATYIGFDEEELGTQFALHMNRNGFIINSDYATDSANYLMVLDTDGGNDGARPKLGAMKVLTSDNKEENVEVVSDLRIDGQTKDKGYIKDDHTFDETKIVGNVYKYWKDSEGKITKMESMVDVADNVVADDYDYVAKNDRLTADGQSYALKDAKVLFAVKPHKGTNGYIQHDGSNLKVSADDVLAVKKSDIPDISKDDTNPALLDNKSASKAAWVNSNTAKVILSTSNNKKDIKGAVLGVENFNKFNAGATKVGLVTDVSVSKNDVVSVEVATNGKVETISSVEKTKFDDVVSVKNYKDNETESVGSLKETINKGLMSGSTLKDYLYKNAAYAEITTNADGKLTGVLFMDEKTDEDGAKADLNKGNVVAGNYYQVSRKIVADVEEGKWMSVIKGSAIYADKDNFYAEDSKNTQRGNDFTGDVAYYTIDGTPTIRGAKDADYAGKAASVLNGFDGTPTIKTAEASSVRRSIIENNDGKGDRYRVADVASKLDKDGSGNIVAVYAFDDDMKGESKKNILLFTETTGKTVLKVNETLNMKAEMLDATDSMPRIKDCIVRNAAGDDVTADFTVTSGAANTWTIQIKNDKIAAGKYYVELRDVDLKTLKTYDFEVENTVEVLPIKVSKVEFADKNGDADAAKAHVTADGHSFDIKVTSALARAAQVEAELTVNNVKVYSENTPLTVTKVEQTNKDKGIYTVTVAEAIQNGSNLSVAIVADDKNIHVEGGTNGVLESTKVEAEVQAVQNVTVVGGFDGASLIGNKAPSGGNSIFVKIEGANGTLNDKITVETDKSVPVTVTASGNSAGIYELKQSTTWTKGTYKVLVDGTVVGTVDVADASYTVTAGTDTEKTPVAFMSDDTITYNVTDVVGMSEETLKAAEVAVYDNTGATKQDGKFTASKVEVAQDGTISFTIKVKNNDGSQFLDPSDDGYVVKLGDKAADKKIKIAKVTVEDITASTEVGKDNPKTLAVEIPELEGLATSVSDTLKTVGDWTVSNSGVLQTVDVAGKTVTFTFTTSPTTNGDNTLKFKTGDDAKYFKTFTINFKVTGN